MQESNEQVYSLQEDLAQAKSNGNDLESALSSKLQLLNQTQAELAKAQERLEEMELEMN